MVNYLHTSTHEFTTCNATCTVGSLMRQSCDSSTYGSRAKRNTVLHVQLKIYALFSIISMCNYYAKYKDNLVESENLGNFRIIIIACRRIHVLL